MKGKWMFHSFYVGVLTIILLIGYPPVSAAPPEGEVRSVAPMWGNETPIPYLESSHANDWMHLLYDYLVACTPDGKLSPDLGLAHKWEMSPDALTWTFTLRKGVKFHDGVEVTAKDVKFSIELMMLPDSTSTNATFIRRIVKSIEAKGPHTMVIQCKRPHIFLADFFSNLEGLDGMVVPKDYYEKVGRDGFAKHPIGSGPYKWHSQMVGSFIKLEATDRHWRDGVPRFKYMTYLFIPEESTRLAMLKTGEADIARISREAVKDALRAGLNVVSKESAAILVFQPNMQWTSPAFSDIRFRKALNLAIDREAIIKQIFAGLAKPVAAWPGPSISVFGGDLTLKPYPYDPQEARRLVKEGGWEGHEFNLMSFSRAGCPELPLIIETIAGYWEKVGLKPKIRMTEWAVWREIMNERKTQNSIHGNDDPIPPEASSLLPKFMDRWYFKNPRSRVNNPELNEKFARIEKSIDIAEVSKLMREIHRWAYDQYSLIPICEIPDKIATTQRIPKWNPGRRRSDRNYYEVIRQR